MAKEQGLDLIEIAPNAKPPVCKIIDMGKFKYDAQKKANVAKKKQKIVLLTGASRGIGHATVKRFNADGWRVLTCSRQAFDVLTLNQPLSLHSSKKSPGSWAKWRPFQFGSTPMSMRKHIRTFQPD